jgi:hypothetical protein
MKFFSAIGSLSILFGCGIMSLIFGLPERYIERDVKADEMVGTWNVTPDSEADVNKFVGTFPDWGATAPWKTFTLNNDGSCIVEIKNDWLGNFYSDLATVNMTSCSWNLAREKNLSDKISPVLELEFGYPDNYGTALFSLYIFEENGKLITWNFIGDADDFLPQDFVKVEK